MKKRWYECSAETVDYANEIYCVCAETPGKARDIASYELDVPFIEVGAKLLKTGLLCQPDLENDYTKFFILDRMPPVVDKTEIGFSWFEHFMPYGHIEKEDED